MQLPIAPSFVVSTSKVFSANNTNVAVPVFSVVGDVLIKRIWAIVTTVIGANHTGGHFQLNDQTAVVDITLAAGGATLSALPVGTKMVKSALAATIATVTSAAAGAIVEPAAAQGIIASEFAVLQKTGGIATNIEYHYYTTDTPTTGACKFFCEFQPRSDSATVNPL